jgi:hypothetical protein
VRASPTKIDIRIRSCRGECTRLDLWWRWIQGAHGVNLGECTEGMRGEEKKKKKNPGKLIR